MKRHNLCRTIAVAVISLAASAASADMMTYEGLGHVAQVTVDADGHLIDGRRVYAGEYHYEYQDLAYDAYCVDINHWADDSEVVERDLSLLGANAEQIAYLFETYGPNVDSGTDGAALGVAIWELIYEDAQTSYDVSSGSFAISNSAAVTAAANDLLTDLPATYSPAGELVVLDSPCKQDMLISLGGMIPEPATVALLGLGAGVLLRRRRR